MASARDDDATATAADTGADVYHRLVLEHSRHPRNFGVLEGAERAAGRDNPLCGDRVAVSLVLGGGTRVADVRFEGVGCAISMAAASMMTESIKGLTRAEAEALAARFERLLAGEAPKVSLGDLDAFAAVARFPVRARCARLPWQALLAALADRVTG